MTVRNVGYIHFKNIYFFMYRCGGPCLYTMCEQVPMESRRGWWASRPGVRQFLAAIWVLGIKLRPTGRATSALNWEAILQPPGYMLFK